MAIKNVLGASPPVRGRDEALDMSSLKSLTMAKDRGRVKIMVSVRMSLRVILQGLTMKKIIFHPPHDEKLLELKRSQGLLH